MRKVIVAAALAAVVMVAGPALGDQPPPASPAAAAAVVDTGTIAGQALTWVVTVFGTSIGTVLTALILRLLKNAGIQGADMLKGQLQALIVNGLNAGAAEASASLANKGKVEIRNAAIASAVRYVQVHGADTLKALGEDPLAQSTVEGIKARIATAIADPAAPTPAVLAPTDQQTAPGRG